MVWSVRLSYLLFQQLLILLIMTLAFLEIFRNMILDFSLCLCFIFMLL